jgi:hypothetical protein
LVTYRKNEWKKNTTQAQNDSTRKYMLKNLDNMPPAWSEKPEFVKLLEIAEVSNLSPEEMNAYQHDLKMLRDEHNVREFAIEEAVKEKAIEFAYEMKQNGEPIDKIIKYTKLTTEQIEAL